MHQAFFDKLAAEWDLMFTAVDLEFLSHIVDGLGASEGMDILDIGCGTGILFDMLRRKVGPEGSITGVDFSFEMAQKAH
ncbi:MAG: methyltransferase domain-containing protein, partial [bacterium]